MRFISIGENICKGLVKIAQVARIIAGGGRRALMRLKRDSEHRIKTILSELAYYYVFIILILRGFISVAAVLIADYWLTGCT